MYWLKHYNIREVQYMAGHRYISSTECDSMQLLPAELARKEATTRPETEW